jgi:hypothetical protein
MNESELKSGSNEDGKTQTDWNVNAIVEQVFGDLHGTVTRSTIQEVLKDVVHNYEGARIQTYVPIFIRRDVVNQLKSMQAPFASPGMVIDEANTRNESQANSDLSPLRNASDEQDKTIGTGLIHWKPAA